MGYGMQDSLRRMELTNVDLTKMQSDQTANFRMEVFDTIMEKVGFMDLMRCKLMCHSWWKGIDGMRPSAKAAIRRKVEALQI